MKILKPICAPVAYDKAAEAFQSLYAQVTGRQLEIVTESAAEEDLIVIGADDVQPYCAHAQMCGILPRFSMRYGTDDYCITSVHDDVRNLLFLAGGRGRSTLYAVYDFFERRAGCHYFWDGDVIGRQAQVDITGLAISEHPRFDYRGLRYFAHRGLHRFQAEHWGLADWQREIDWMVKRRLNVFMLRIGMDDLYQRAFPDQVPYPPAVGRLPEATAEGYDDRTLFWPLEYRGLLRKKLLRYAFDRDLMHPEDSGTMTHWYSRTPHAFLESEKPTFLGQTTAGYSDQTGLVWDIREKRNLDHYLRLTDAHVEAYGKPEIFHTIGLAERMVSNNRADNLKMKLLTYRLIARGLRERYPHAPLWIASWDFVMYWQAEEVQALLRELDPTRTVILDYTSESPDPANSFLHWGVVGKFPWIFGIFHAYEANSEVRGSYERITERLTVAKDDPMCKGMVFWPELSHSDTLMLDYFCVNAWSPLTLTLSEWISQFCAHRYGAQAQAMERIWLDFLPLIALNQWPSFTRRTPDDPDYKRYKRDWSEREIEMCMLDDPSRLVAPSAETLDIWKDMLVPVAALRDSVPRLLRALADIAPDTAMLRRDMVDIARTLLGRRIHFGLMHLQCMVRDWKMDACARADIDAQLAILPEAMQSLAALLGCHADYSMYASLLQLGQECPVNPDFEPTLKHNLVNGYCRQYAYEPMAYLFLDECRVYCTWVRTRLDAQDKGIWQVDFRPQETALYARFMATPLAQMQPTHTEPLPTLLPRLAAVADQICVSYNV